MKLSENVGLSNANIGENPMPENLRVPPQVRPRRVSRGLRSAERHSRWTTVNILRGRENASSQCSNTRRYLPSNPCHTPVKSSSGVK
ncbi:hypothetical protein H5410_056307 [Solanum commersonii]|uniref:Uncharacterized protein n=1 Tax=Solanum commersonii TaxID=4109 RepID=A0A9J5WLC4_SOLCO|nr:hypothetical protein H5410_056307 [Solanum commersonii]